MTTSQTRDQGEIRSRPLGRWRVEKVTLILLFNLAVIGAVFAGWILGKAPIVAAFDWLNAAQLHPPAWVEIPHQSIWVLIAPTVALLAVVSIVMKYSPRPTFWSRLVIVGILLVLLGRYVAWRSLSTLNFADPINGLASLGLFTMELLVISSTGLQLALLMLSRDRRSEADELSLDVLNGTFTPSVDVLIPTYDEPSFILKRTVVGCQAMDYPCKTIYLLDDTDRPDIEALAQELGCQYITRPNNLHAKAGNLNHAIAHTQGDLIVVFDADFIPTRNFLTRTVGFFQRPRVAMVQTPQTFYNPDPIARNLGLENILTPEEEVFYRQIQPMRDGAGGVICAGTSFIVRRSALEALGGFVTESLSEDYFTGVRLAAQQYQLIYLDEKLSAGLAAEGIAAQALQRIRWAQGTLQAFFIPSSPLTVPGLRPLQRLAHLEGILYWFTSLARLAFLAIPLAYLLFGLVPIHATVLEAVYFFVPYYLVQLSVFSWLNQRSRSALLSELYSLVLCFPLACTVVKAFAQPFGSRFQVTPKGTSRDRYTFNWRLAYPLLIMLTITAVSFAYSLYHTDAATLSQEFNLGWIWSIYNLVLLSISLLILCDAPRPYTYDWFSLRRTVHVCLHSQTASLCATSAALVSPSSRAISDRAFQPYQHSLSPDLPAPSPSTQPAYSFTHQLIRHSEDKSTVSAFPSHVASIEKEYPLRSFWGVTTMLSEGGAEIELTSGAFPTVLAGIPLNVNLTLMEDNIQLQGSITHVDRRGDFPIVRVAFEPLPLTTYRQLIEILFCRPGQWKSRQSPGEWRSLLLLFQILLRPRFLCDRQVDIKAVEVAQS